MKTEDLLRHASRYTHLSPDDGGSYDYHVEDTSDEAWAAAEEIADSLNAGMRLFGLGEWWYANPAYPGIGICYDE